jgi:formate/nitrite transporter FocA (FNT family)
MTSPTKNRSSRDSTDHDADRREARKPAIRILEHEISEGLAEIERSDSGLLMSGFSAGMDLGFSILMMAVLLTLAKDSLPRPVTELLVAGAYTLGYILIVIGRSELFTEHTTLAVLPVLNGRATLGGLLRLWGLVYFSNLAGGALFSFIIVNVGPALGIIDPAVFGEIARGLVNHSAWVILFSGVLAGWLMGLLSWLVAASRETVSQIIVIVLVTGTIGLAHLHHAIAGTIEVLTGLMSGQGITVADYLHFLLWATVGNSLGGVFFVAVVKYGQAMRSNHHPKNVKIE